MPRESIKFAEFKFKLEYNCNDSSIFDFCYDVIFKNIKDIELIYIYTPKCFDLEMYLFFLKDGRYSFKLLDKGVTESSLEKLEEKANRIIKTEVKKLKEKYEKEFQELLNV